MPPSLDAGVDAIVAEVRMHGDAVMVECLDYVLYQAAGSSPKVFANAPFPRDCDEGGVRTDRRTPTGEGMRLADFVRATHRSPVPKS